MGADAADYCNHRWVFIEYDKKGGQQMKRMPVYLFCITASFEACRNNPPAVLPVYLPGVVRRFAARPAAVTVAGTRVTG